MNKKMKLATIACVSTLLISVAPVGVAPTTAHAAEKTQIATGLPAYMSDWSVSTSEDGPQLSMAPFKMWGTNLWVKAWMWSKIK
ncbi:hypothetical protein ACRHK7_03125 [Weissella tructae]|uniref:Uncharacterized protein n=2 Tax=Weissella TaxID=46255 RepID=A0A075TX49_9LACO|nr:MULTISPECIES: hypothetical protein [Weissella]AIG66154.1 hypothetical protein WS08_1216 [Weissella tructae]AIM63535.1 hypothetical protein WS74_1286 [Weissella ceti]ELA07527.1 hypothetical protein WCNC_03687 [Weissella ceti NC36]QVV91303.1 hypothetical protein KHQ32_06740 [Weissella tructae]